MMRRQLTTGKEWLFFLHCQVQRLSLYTLSTQTNIHKINTDCTDKTWILHNTCIEQRGTYCCSGDRYSNRLQTPPVPRCYWW